MELSRPRLLLGLGMIILASVWIQLSYGVVIQDDAYISFRYARNLLDGHGLVYNVGERVEGYTNFLWTMIIAFGMWGGVSPEVVSVAGGMLSAIALIVVTWRMALRRYGSSVVSLLAPLLVGLTPDFDLEAVAGLEGAFFSFLVVLGLYLTFGGDPDRAGSSAAAAMVWAMASLTRPEAVLMFAFLQVSLVLAVRSYRDHLRRSVWAWIVFTGILGAHLIFRLIYYGDILPNTFYAKTGGGLSQWSRGAAYMGSWCTNHPVLLVLGLLGVLVMSVRRSRWDIALIGFVLVYSTYVIAVGGDYNPSFRFVHPFLAAICLLAAEAVVFAVRRWRSRAPSILLVCLLLFGADFMIEMRRCRRAADGFYRTVWKNGLLIGDFFRKSFLPSTTIGVYAAGIVPYVTAFRAYDTFGLTNEIARRDFEGMGTGIAGHEKLDEAFVLQRVDLFLPLRALKRQPVRIDLPAAEFSELFELRIEEISDPDDRPTRLWLHFFVRKR